MMAFLITVFLFLLMLYLILSYLYAEWLLVDTVKKIFSRWRIVEDDEGFSPQYFLLGEKERWGWYKFMVSNDDLEKKVDFTQCFYVAGAPSLYTHQSTIMSAIDQIKRAKSLLAKDKPKKPKYKVYKV